MGNIRVLRHWPQLVNAFAFFLLATIVLADKPHGYNSRKPNGWKLPHTPHLLESPPLSHIYESPPPPYVYKSPPPPSPSPPHPYNVYKSPPPPTPSPPYVYKSPPAPSHTPHVGVHIKLTAYYYKSPPPPKRY